jgi:hypothetical protein
MEVTANDHALDSHSSVVSSQSSHKPIYVFKYNKFSGEFECDE